MSIQFTTLQSWLIVGAFMVLLMVTVYATSRDTQFQNQSVERSKEAAKERSEMVNLSKLIISDIEKLSPEEEEKLVTELQDVFSRGIPAIENDIAMLNDALQEYVHLLVILALDTDEDVEQVKHTHELILDHFNITDTNPVPDIIKLDYNRTHLILNDETVIDVKDMIPSDVE